MLFNIVTCNDNGVRSDSFDRYFVDARIQHFYDLTYFRGDNCVAVENLVHANAHAEHCILIRIKITLSRAHAPAIVSSPVQRGSSLAITVYYPVTRNVLLL